MAKWLMYFYILVKLQNIMYGQNTVYSLNPAREISLFGAGVSFNALGFIQSRNVSVLRVEDIEKLSRKDLDGLDRTATYNYSNRAKKASDNLLLGSLFLPATVMLDPNQHHQVRENGVILLQTYLLNAGSTLLVKSVVRRTRPFVYNESAPLSEKLKADARMSFFSGHTSFTATSTFFTASMLTANGQNRDLAPVIWSSAAVLPALQGYLRWKAGKHFPTDIFIGYAVGAGLGYLIPKIHEGF
jgi:membrane-associated phospholipid phosphatase